eukprot:4569558-Pyramimonas_sp.AAC.1
MGSNFVRHLCIPVVSNLNLLDDRPVESAQPELSNEQIIFGGYRFTDSGPSPFLIIRQTV